MTVTILESIESREETFGDSVSHIRRYTVTDLTDPASYTEVETAIKAEAPSTVSVDGTSYPRLTIQARPVIVDNGGLWECEVRYGEAKGSPPRGGGSTESSFEIGGRTEEISCSLALVASYAASGIEEPIFDGALNVDSNGDVAGATIGGSEAPAIMSTSKIWSTSDVDSDYITKICRMVNKVNSGSYSIAGASFAAGEVRFIGASGRKRNSSQWDINFRFGISENKSGIYVGHSSKIGPITKKGWDYLWVYFREQELTGVGSAYMRVKVPIAAYVEQVYFTDSFSDLDL